MPRTTYFTPDFSLPIEDRVLALSKEITADPNFNGPDAVALRQARLISAVPNKTQWELEIMPYHCNKTGNLHGGAATTILDNLTSTCLHTIAKPGFLEYGHVSRTITMTYLRPVPLGAKTQIFCEVVAAGKNTAHVKGEIRNEAGKVCVTCLHDKAVFSEKPKL